MNQPPWQDGSGPPHHLHFQYQPQRVLPPLLPPLAQNVLLTASGDRAKLADVGMAMILVDGSMRPGVCAARACRDGSCPAASCISHVS